MSLSFDVVPQDRGHIEIGDKYLFSASSYGRILGKERTLVGASVSVTDNPDGLGSLQALFPAKEIPICGYAAFYPERQGSLDFDPASLHYTIVVEPHLLAEMIRTAQLGAGGATLSLGIEGLEHGWEPDGSHLILRLEEQGNERLPITSFSYSVERFWTSEGAIRDERDRRLDAELADSPDPEARKLAALSVADRKPDAMTVLLKECRSLLLSIAVLVVVAIVSLNW